MSAKYVHYGSATVRAAIGFDDLVAPVADAFMAFSRGLGEAPVSIFSPAGREGDVHVKSAWLPGRAIFTVKVATWFAGRAVGGQPPSAGFVAAFDSRTGDLLALLEDEHHISDVRTAAAGAVATRALARPDSTALAVIGAGTQAYLQVLAVAAQLPIRTVKIWGRDPGRAGVVARAVRTRCPHLLVTVAPTPRDACEGADVLITATASTQPLIMAEWLSAGMHITAVGADDAGKVELAGACFERADVVVVDSRVLTAQYGDLALAGVDPNAEIGEVLADPSLGRTEPGQVTISKLVGLGVQDLVAAEIALDRLRRGARPTQLPASGWDLQTTTAVDSD